MEKFDYLKKLFSVKEKKTFAFVLILERSYLISSEANNKSKIYHVKKKNPCIPNDNSGPKTIQKQSFVLYKTGDISITETGMDMSKA